MRLLNVHIVEQEALKDLHIAEGRIAAISSVGASPSAGPSSPADQGPSSPAEAPLAPLTLSFENAIALPGLINSHDHLDFDLFPRLGNRIYSSYTEWGSDIHQSNKENIASVLRIPRELRIRWGIYKNLLGGVTSVIHHGAYLATPQDLISISQNAESLHSISGEKGWRRKLLHPFRRQRQMVIHIGEGTTPACSKEVSELIRWNIFGRPLIGIHGIAMSEKQAAAFEALVWCPDSNFFLYGKTADIQQLRRRTTIVFGTDSTLTASWNIWQQLRLARELKMTDDTALWEMATSGPARLWGLDQCGKIAEGRTADLVIAARTPGTTGWNAVFGVKPRDILLVLHQGNIRLFDESLRDQLTNPEYLIKDFHPIAIDGKIKYIQGDLPGLMQEIQTYRPDASFPVTAI
jgi:cytosine/adenosine deaminase-related metal-dependent hydrolase